MNQSDSFSHSDSLALIEEMIYKARNSYHESGTSSLLWGSIIMFCSAASLANTWWHVGWLNQVWLLTIVAIIPQVVISIRESKAQKFKTHTDDAMNGIWISFGIGIFLLSYYSAVFQPAGGTTLFLILYGMPTFATGITHRFKAMIAGGVVCWASAIASIYTAIRTDLVLYFISAFFAWFLPGLILRSRYLKEKRKTNV